MLLVIFRNKLEYHLVKKVRKYTWKVTFRKGSIFFFWQRVCKIQFLKMGKIIKMKTQFLEKHLSEKITIIISNNKSIMKTLVMLQSEYTRRFSESLVYRTSVIGYYQFKMLFYTHESWINYRYIGITFNNLYQSMAPKNLYVIICKHIFKDKIWDSTFAMQSFTG